MSARPPMPATLQGLADSLGLPVDVVRRLAIFVRTSMATHAFREIVDPALELLAGAVPPWPLLDDWNRWCLESGARFFVWPPRSAGLDDHQRLEALVHTVMMLAGKEENIADYGRASIKEVEIVMAGDDCPVCEEHRHHVVGLAPPAMKELPPFHPGCRCGTLPRLE